MSSVLVKLVTNSINGNLKFGFDDTALLIVVIQTISIVRLIWPRESAIIIVYFFKVDTKKMNP